MRRPRISVILPTHNRAGLLARSAGSVLRQTWRDLELIIVDDGSTEDIAGALLGIADDRVRHVRRELRGGVAAARNTGVANATGELLAFQDSDDEWLLHKLSRQVEVLEHRADGAPEMAVCGLLRVGEGSVRRYPAPAVNAWLPFERVISPPVAYTQTWLVPRQALIEAGGFDERLGIWDDWDMLLRLSRRLRIRIFDEALVISEARADSLSKVQPRWIEDMRIIMRTHERALSAHPGPLAELEYVFARYLAGAGLEAEARQMLWRSVRRDPLAVRPWLLLAAGVFDPRMMHKVLQ